MVAGRGRGLGRSWLGQDAHPHPIYAHAGDRIFFNSRMAHTVNVYAVSARTPQ